MNDEDNRLNILLVEDIPSKSELISEALAQAKIRCKLHTVDASRDTVKYLRGDGPYAAAPRPDLIFFDVCTAKSNRLKILDQVRADAANREIPLVLLTSIASEQVIDEIYNQADRGSVFSAIKLNSFLRTMRARTPDRFLSAVSLIQKLGLVLVRVPGDSAEAGAEMSVSALA